MEERRVRLVDRVLASKGYQRRIVLEVSSFRGVVRLVGRTELPVIVPRRLGETLVQQEAVRLFEPPPALPPFAVKPHWHARLHADAGNVWLRQRLCGLFSGGEPKRPPARRAGLAKP